MSTKCIVCKRPIFDENGQCLGEEVDNRWFCHEHIPPEFSHFKGERFYPRTENAHKDVLLVSDEQDYTFILVKVDNDHPLLVILNKKDKTFDVEGYD